MKILFWSLAYTICNETYVYVSQALSRDALDKLDTVKMKASIEKTHYQDMEEPIPDQLSEKLEQINNLEDTIKVCISFVIKFFIAHEITELRCPQYKYST